MNSKIKRSIFGLSKKGVNRLIQEKEQEYAEDLKEKLDRINELKKDVRSMNEQIEKYKKNEAYMADTLVGVMERAESAELREAEATARIGLIKQQLIQINSSYIEHMQALQQAQADLTALIANAEIAPIEGSQLLLNGLPGTEQEAEHSANDAGLDTEEEYRFNELRKVKLNPIQEENGDGGDFSADDISETDEAVGPEEIEKSNENTVSVSENEGHGEEEAALEDSEKNGFDMKEALTGKERLDEICKELGLI